MRPAQAKPRIPSPGRMGAPGPFVIVGAGPAGMRAAETIRSCAPDTEVVLIGDEPHLPYERPPLSKAYLTEPLAIERLYLKPERFYAEQRIDLRLNIRADRIDRRSKQVELAGGDRIRYGRLVLTTGCRCRRMPAAGDGPTIHYLRDLRDAAALRSVLEPGARIVIIGGGFIGLELAASASKRGAQVTVLEAAPQLLTRVMPPVIGDHVRALHQAHGVQFEFDARISAIAARGGRVRVATARAEHECDAVVAGIGAEPNVELAETAGLETDNGICVDQYGRTADPDIFAAGDATRHYNPLLGRTVRAESWQVALNHAAAVARVAAGGSEPYVEIPWLWSDQYDCNIQLLGLPESGLQFVLRGDPAGRSFTAIGVRSNDRIAAAVTVNNGREIAMLRRLIAQGAALPHHVLADSGQKLLAPAKPAPA